ncbi:MAG: hypothetical protein ACTS6J_12150 [Burkholderiales bacterium]
MTAPTNQAVPVSREVLDELQRDAARYRWLRNPTNPVHRAYYSRGDYGRGLFTGSALDAAIDAAMEKS